MSPWHPKGSKTAKLNMLLLTSTHTSRGIDYCQRKDNRFYKPLIGAGAASGQIEKWCLRRCFIGGPTGAFCHGRESCNDWRHSKAPAEGTANPLDYLTISTIKVQKNTLNIGWCMLDAYWVRTGRNYFHSHLLIHCSPHHCSIALLSWHSAAQGSSFGTHILTNQ